MLVHDTPRTDADEPGSAPARLAPSVASALVDYTMLDPTHLAPDRIRVAHQTYERLIGLWAPAIIEAAHDLGLFAAVAEHPGTSTELADRLHTDRQATRVLLDALHVYGLLERDDHPTGEPCYLLLDAVAACTVVGGAFSLVGKFEHDRHTAWPAWRQLSETVRRGNADHGRPADNQISTEDYLALAGGIAFWAPPIIRRLSTILRERGWDAAGVVLDVGCGSGQYARLLLQEFPVSRLTAFDVPEIVEIARQAAAVAGLDDRFTALPGDFCADPWPGGQDLLLLCNIFHLFSPVHAASLAQLAAGAVSASGYVCIVDQIRVDQDARATPQDRFAALFAASMLATGGGDTYRLDQYDGWLTAAGLQRVALLDTPMHRILLAQRR